ncbi:hypothetical protein [Caldalkalibacillus mannanilyticus]|uniref:hypothetical protein n=1 Tax=Caldalkalibacillus mannanilyticus TaxID=1418 RepID=UPI000467F46C|nr:hypothetical protein [Caldalkalibacillus mannanilyticus]
MKKISYYLPFFVSVVLVVFLTVVLTESMQWDLPFYTKALINVIAAIVGGMIGIYLSSKKGKQEES